MKLNANSNCNLFKSCKKTKYASQVSAMGTAAGFTTFQGAEAHLRQPVYIEFEYPDEGGIVIDFENCDYDNGGKTTFHDFPYGGNCECNACDALCSYDPSTTNIAVLNGINPVKILLVLAFVICLTVMLLLFKDYSRRKYLFELRQGNRRSLVDNNA